MCAEETFKDSLVQIEKGRSLEDLINLSSSRDTSLFSNSAFIFNDKMLKLPFVTQDKQLVIGTFCYGYNEETYLIVPAIQVGCPIACTFCQVGEFGYKRDLTAEEIITEIKAIAQKAHQYGLNPTPKEARISFVGDGDPLTNKNMGTVLRTIAKYASPQIKISTTYPSGEKSNFLFNEIIEFASSYQNIVQFQISLNSTDENYRRSLTKYPLADFQKIKELGKRWMEEVPFPNKVNLTFTLNKASPCSPEDIIDVLTPEYFAIRLRNWAPTERGLRKGHHPVEKSKIEELAEKFSSAGYFLVPGRTGLTENQYQVSAGQINKIYQMLCRP